MEEFSFNSNKGLHSNSKRMRLIRDPASRLWQHVPTDKKLHTASYLKSFYKFGFNSHAVLYPWNGEHCGDATLMMTIEIANTKTRLYDGHYTVLKGCHASSLTKSIVVNATTTASSTALTLWVHEEVIQSVPLAILVAFSAYIVVVYLFHFMIGFGGASISNTPSIVLDEDASIAFLGLIECKMSASCRYLISLELDNSLVSPVQQVHCAYMLAALVKEV